MPSRRTAKAVAPGFAFAGRYTRRADPKPGQDKRHRQDHRSFGRPFPRARHNQSGRSSHPDRCPGMWSSKSSCEGVGSQLRPMVLPQQIARRSDPVPHSSPLVHSVAGARPSGPALHSRSHGATPTGTRRRDRHIHMPVIQDRQRRRPAPHAAACASAS